MADQNTYERIRYRRRRAELLEYVGGDNPVCAKCGSTERLQFDHIDPLG